MYGYELEVTVDLGGKPRGDRAIRLHDELLAALQADPHTYSLKVSGLQAYPSGGMTVQIRQGRVDGGDLRCALKGMPVAFARIKMGGSDHFPLAGLYDWRTLRAQGITGATATVTHAIDREFPMTEEIIERVVRAVRYDDYVTGIRLDLPMGRWRTWSLTLTAPTLDRAERAYALLRAGTWQPAVTFVDSVPDDEKVQLLRQEIAQEDDEL